MKNSVKLLENMIKFPGENRLKKLFVNLTEILYWNWLRFISTESFIEHILTDYVCNLLVLQQKYLFTVIQQEVKKTYGD